MLITFSMSAFWELYRHYLILKKKYAIGILAHFTEKGSEVKVLVIQSCPIIGDRMNCSLPNSSVHGVLQARILEWVAVSSSRGSSPPRDWTCISYISCIAGGFFTAEPSEKPWRGVQHILNQTWASRMTEILSLNQQCKQHGSYGFTKCVS